MHETAHISSLIVHARPDALSAVKAFIEREGGEVSQTDPRGKMIVVIETRDSGEITRFANTLSLMDGVLSANLVFHAIDEISGFDAPLPPEGDAA